MSLFPSFRHAPCLGTVHHEIIIFGTFVLNDDISRCFFHFFKIFILWIKGQKMAQNDKRFCLFCSITQETYIIWLSFMVHMSKMTISPGVNDNISDNISIFQNFNFPGRQGGEGQKWSKMTKNSICCALYFRNHIPYDLYLWYVCMYKRISSSGIFFIFSKFWFFGFWGAWKGKKWPKIANFSLFCSIS